MLKKLLIVINVLRLYSLIIIHPVPGNPTTGAVLRYTFPPRLSAAHVAKRERSLEHSFPTIKRHRQGSFIYNQKQPTSDHRASENTLSWSRWSTLPSIHWATQKEANGTYYSVGIVRKSFSPGRLSVCSSHHNHFGNDGRFQKEILSIFYYSVPQSIGDQLRGSSK